MKYLLILILGLFALNAAWAQTQTPVKLYSSGQNGPKGMPLDTLKKVIAASEILLEKYNQYGTMRDTAGRVTRNSVKLFNSLFAGNGKTFKDFAEYPSKNMIDAINYSDEVFYRLKTHGLVYKIISANLSDLRYDSAGYYQPTITIEKVLYNLVSKEGTELKKDGGIKKVLNIVIDIPTGDLNYARILRIEDGSDKPDPVDDYQQYLGVGIHGGLMAAGAAKSNFYTSNAAALAKLKKPRLPGDISMETGMSFGAGFYWKTNRFVNAAKKKKKPLFLNAGLEASFLSVKTQLENYSISDFPAKATFINGKKQSYLRIVDSVFATQKDALILLELPIGLSLRLKETKTIALFLNLQFVPQFAVVSSSSLVGSARYDGLIDDANFRFLELEAVYQKWLTASPSDPDNPLGPYHIGKNVPLDFNGSSLKTGLGYSFRLSPEAYFKPKKNNAIWGFMVGLDLSFNLKSVIQHTEPEGLPLAFESNDVVGHDQDGMNQSILQRLYKDSKFSSIGLRLGIYRLLSRKVEQN